MKKSLLAFTLAEVLITLTIIGVIAAITIPNLMQSWRKHEKISQIKSAYSILQNAIKMATAEHGNPDGWDYSGNGKEFSEKYILPYMKYQYICGYGSANSRCFDKGSWYYLARQKSESDDGYGAYNHYQIKLQNGMDLGIYNGSVFKKKPWFVVDVNGQQGPTQAGNDVWGFILYGDENKLRTGWGWVSSFNLGYSYYISGTYNGACTTSAGMSGLACTRVIEQNGWDFPDNYPIKKF